MNNSSFTEDESFPHRDVFMGITVALFILGMLGNVLVMIVIGKRSNRSIHDMFILNLAVSDCLFILLVLPIYAYKLYATFKENEFFCRVIYLFQTISYFISIFTITSMAIYRCYVIVNPYRRAKLTPKIGYAAISFVWFSAFVIVLPLAVVNKSVDGRCQEIWFHDSHAKVYTAVLFVLQFLLPLSIIGGAYARIGIFLLRQKQPQSSLGDSRKDSRREKRRRENKQVITTLAAIVVLFTICLLPGQIAWMVDYFGTPDREKITVVYRVSTILDFIHACVNPVIYALLTDRFRKGYMDILTKVVSCGRASITPDLESSLNMPHNDGTNESGSKAPDRSNENILSDEIQNRSSVYNVADDELDYKF